jgi:23S rRNA (cytosine1962-C5)-methyltransferase
MTNKTVKGKEDYPRIVLKKGREVSLQRRHPWVFSGAIHSVSHDMLDGEIAQVYSAEGKYIATGFVEPGSIAVKIISNENTTINPTFWAKKIQQAYQLREVAGLARNASTSAWRLVFTEGDGLPGLVLDYYDGVVVFQAQSAGMYDAKHQIAEALRIVLGNNLKAVYDKSGAFREQNSSPAGNFLYGESLAPVEVSENGHRFLIDFINGQKTGFFIDQRESRALVARYAPGRKVLNLFSYTGGFSVYALKAGAHEVYSVDSSASAIEMAGQHIALNNLPENLHKGVVADVKRFLPGIDKDFDLIILDPPAFAKHKESRHKAMLGYKYLNNEVLQKIKSGGILFTFSCSQVVNSELFESTVMAAAIEAGRDVRIIHRLSHAPDHPVSIYHPEGSYLKGLVLYVS